jgi:hypothetical protein
MAGSAIAPDRFRGRAATCEGSGERVAGGSSAIGNDHRRGSPLPPDILAKDARLTH